MTEPLLKVENLNGRYEPSPALFGVFLEVAPGPLLAVLGATEAQQEVLDRSLGGADQRTSTVDEDEQRRMNTTVEACEDEQIRGGMR